MAKAMLGGLLAISASVASAPAAHAASVTVPAVRPTYMTAASATAPAPNALASNAPAAKMTGVTRLPVGNVSGDLSLEAATRLAEDYFNGLTTLQAEFSQSVTGEAFGSEGTFYLKKPRQFLWQYDTPTRQKIVGTGTAVYYVDQSSRKGDGQVTQLPMDAGLNRLFGAKALKLNGGGLRVAGVYSTPAEMALTLTVDKGATGQAGLKAVKLVFARKPALVIRSIEATDTTQVVTRVTFADVKTGVAFTPKLFDFTPGVYKSAN